MRIPEHNDDTFQLLSLELIHIDRDNNLLDYAYTIRVTRKQEIEALHIAGITQNHQEKIISNLNQPSYTLTCVKVVKGHQTHETRCDASP
jgi:hypothetical protein